MATNTQFTSNTALSVPENFTVPSTQMKSPSVITSQQAENKVAKIQNVLNQPSGSYKVTDNPVPVYGESSQAVLALQQQLNAKNKGVPGYTPIAEDGKYGQQTLGAVNFVAPTTNTTNNTQNTNKDKSNLDTTDEALVNYLKNKKTINDNINKAFNDFQDTLSNIRSGNSLTSSQTKALNALNQAFEFAKAEQAKSNESETGVVNLVNMRGGASRYSPEVAAGRVQLSIQTGIKRIQNIANEQQLALEKMRNEFEQGNMKNARDSYTDYITYSNNLDKQITDTYTSIYNYNKDVADAKFKQLQEDNKQAQNVIDNTFKQIQLTETERHNRAEESIKRKELEQKVTGASADPIALKQWAEEYAQTGKLPTGVPANLRQSVAMLATTVKQPAGRVVSAITGMPDPTLDSALQQGLSSGADAIKRLDQLGEVFSQIHTGLIGGTFGAAFPSTQRQIYNDMRDEIIMLIRQARSGQAFSVKEAESYENMLPTNWNEPTFLQLGADGLTKIQNLKNSMEMSLNTKLAQNGLMITQDKPVKNNQSDGQQSNQPKQVEYQGKIYNVDANGDMTPVQ